MKKVSAIELKRLKKKAKVRRKMGAQPVKESPAPVAPEGKGMSGSEPTELPAPAPVSASEPLPVATEATEPMASMSASMAYRDTMLENLIANNTKVIDEFRLALADQKPRPGIAYRHKVVRDKKSSLIDEVISTPMDT